MSKAEPKSLSERDPGRPHDIGDGRTSDDTDAFAHLAITKLESAPVYSVFSKRMKVFITVTSALGSCISPLSSMIYLPALTELSTDLHVTISKINLTLTCYSILQAIAPAFCKKYHKNLTFLAS